MAFWTKVAMEAAKATVLVGVQGEAGRRRAAGPEEDSGLRVGEAMTLLVSTRQLPQARLHLLEDACFILSPAQICQGICACCLSLVDNHVGHFPDLAMPAMLQYTTRIPA